MFLAFHLFHDMNSFINDQLVEQVILSPDITIFLKKFFCDEARRERVEPQRRPVPGITGRHTLPRRDNAA